MSQALLNLMTVAVLCSWINDINARLYRMENPYR